MKIIFLDIDGVLNSDDDRIYISGPNQGKAKKRSPHICGFAGIDHKKVRILGELVRDTGAKVVLTSTWKACYEIATGNDDAQEPMLSKANARKMGKYLVDKLAKEGIEVFGSTYGAERYIDEYGLQQTFGRGRGINRWLAAHKKTIDVEAWVALDDERYGYAKDQFPHLVQTDPECCDRVWVHTGTAGDGYCEYSNYRRGGLTPADVEKAKRILNNEFPETGKEATVEDDHDIRG